MIPLPDLTHEPAAEDATHDGGEGDLELLVGHDIDYWVEGGVKIACKSKVQIFSVSCFFLRLLHQEI